MHVKHAVSVPFERRDEVAVSEVMDPPVLVPESLELDDLLDTLRAGGLQMALVVDEFGNVTGLVTLEDLVEEIVGEVHDEHDESEEPARREADGTWTHPRADAPGRDPPRGRPAAARGGGLRDGRRADRRPPGPDSRPRATRSWWRRATRTASPAT